MHTLASAKPEWWTNVNVDMSDYSNSISSSNGTGMDALDAGVPVATVTSRQGESENGLTVDLQAMKYSSPCTAEDETVYGTVESRPLSTTQYWI
jgi:hypothetical protein